MQGILLVDKQKSWTSFDVVNYVRKIVAGELGKKPKNVKVGHTGTLDPEATGLLVILVGKEYTKKATELSKVDKTYEVTMKLGETSTTGDAEGEKTVVSELQPTKDALEITLQTFAGESQQTPPAYSAIKIDGQRAYKLARAGKVVHIEPRTVRMGNIMMTDYSYPYVQFSVTVSSGTYIRSLVEDIGKKLKTGAYMSDLRRTRVGDCTLKDAIPVTKDTQIDEIKARLQNI